ncbi:hypothetical protein EHI8A_090200 [Entamoeba histolytica HM-1:IMSS-B]|uniref:GATA-type domain-containing protein n=8 Tax=Entamoeba TaxID=5758 RepID=C4M459_ENTH1|nr:hypothetical protein ENU1_124630 [Entamoeba nuttalli P19]XP_649811.1 hypothetical protein EHI_030480 [Entamoeba histolytica HM-1:IMSS]EMD49424.1 Hypothetical protein EHI5A_104670 [Entamoeba histolytica KU27]EMH75195.1 hypothetical protein EHI8A_090200 [Entamoeba histolytica HM-1:IMSS-B]EMS17974.1 hypothetical protein KM1_129930 [Entamoeba histolytica HM-3:IMSS]ENY63163.1 hypothetical protein EHI7A_103620 [Entamoeba histolytica HM-1:IMSS-A]GAT96138.1 hypothetical protein CL6EHI_030480 [Enta|eukprot:XP_008858124.1 hypothetical protein ENU1_124630 [Entamoeba nuttalli P19]
MAEDNPQFPTKIKTLSLEILTILYSRDLTHEELVSFRKRLMDIFNEFQKQAFSNYSADHILQLEAKIKQQQQAQYEALEKERSARIAALQEKTCCICGKKSSDWKKGVNPDEYYCTPCSLNFTKKGDENRMVMERPLQ